MKYTNNDTHETVEAYRVGEAIHNGANHAVTLPEVGRMIGLFPEQTASHAPVAGDFYIDRGEIGLGRVVARGDFLAAYARAL